MEARLINMEARQVNSVAADLMDPLRGLRNEAGDPFPNFPDTLEGLYNMNGGAMTALLLHYGMIGGGANAAKMHRINKFIGLRIA